MLVVYDDMNYSRLYLSEKGTIRHSLEMDVLNYFQDFLQEAEDTDGSGESKDGAGSDTTEMESNNSEVISVPGILQWLTGQPILPNEKNDFSIHIKFNHDCQEENVKSYNEFKYVMTQALKFGNTFSRV